MNRLQAVTIIKQIFNRCQRIEGKSIKLLPPKENNALSKTYQIHIQTRNDEILIACIKGIAEENRLAIKKKDSLLIVYKPYPDSVAP